MVNLVLQNDAGTVPGANAYIEVSGGPVYRFPAGATTPSGTGASPVYITDPGYLAIGYLLPAGTVAPQGSVYLPLPPGAIAYTIASATALPAGVQVPQSVVAYVLPAAVKAFLMPSGAAAPPSSTVYTPLAGEIFYALPVATLLGPYTDFKSYHNDRGQSFAGFTDDQIITGIVRATAYLDKRFNFIGWRRYSGQPTAWPRWDAVDITDRYLRGIPLGVQQATAEYALRALSLTTNGGLMPDVQYELNGRQIHTSKDKVGPIEEQRIYEGGFQMPKYPAADQILISWGLIISGRQIVRG